MSDYDYESLIGEEQKGKETPGDSLQELQAIMKNNRSNRLELEEEPEKLEEV